jgi:hypothetical protein
LSSPASVRRSSGQRCPRAPSSDFALLTAMLVLGTLGYPQEHEVKAVVGVQIATVVGLQFVIATTSSETVLPRLIEKLEDLGCDEGIVGLVVADGLFLQSRRHLPLSRDCCGFLGSSYEHAARYLAPNRLTSHPVGHLERSCWCRRSGFCRSCCDVRS